MSAQKSSDWTEPVLRSVADSSPLGLFVVDNRTDAILYFNHLFCEMWSIESLEEAMRHGELKNGDIIPDCLPLVKDVPAFVESCKPLQSEESRAVVEDEVEFVDGRTVRRFSTQIRDVADRYFGRLYIFEDITERKRAEEALARAHAQLETRVKERTMALAEANATLEKEVAERRRSEQALRVSEEQLRLVTDALPVCIAYADSEQRHQFNNKTYEAWFGRSRTELKGRHIKEVLGVSAYEVIRGHVEAALSGQAVSYETSLFLGGKERHVLANYVPHVGEQGETKGYFAFVTDITQRKRAEEERQKLEAKIQHAQKLESLAVLAGGIAHDFNNLLTSVMGNAELALLEMQPESPARPYVQDVVTAAERAAQLTRQMLAYSGKGRFAVESLDLSKLVEEMAHLLEVSISKKVVLKYDTAEGPLPIEADATQLRQVVMNLVTNAAEAIGDRSGSVAIRTGAMAADRDYLSRTYLDEDLPEGDYTYLEVADTGCGMDRSTLERIFDPFFTTKFTGRGLGLAAALGIVRGHKGAIRIDSQPGRGTIFRVLLPTSPTVLEDDRQPPAQAAEGWHGSGTILAVDDEESVRTFVQKVLEKHGFTVVTTKDGREALNVFRLRHDEIVAVVLDLTMPVMDAKETFRELSRLRRDVKVILTSGYNEQDATRQFGRHKLAGFVAKPFQPGKLIAVVRQVLEGGRRDPP